MSAYRLVQMFEDRTDFPVLLDEVRDAVIALGGPDQILFKAVDIDDNVLRGICHRWKPIPIPYALAPDHVDILYAQGLEPEWRRLVITKELIHILDKDAHRTQNEDQLNDLIRRMARRPELRDPMNWHETSDRVGVFQALGILFPYSARELIKEKYELGNISDEMIAHRAGIPVHYVSFLMSEDWTAMYHDFMRLCEMGAAEAA